MDFPEPQAKRWQEILWNRLSQIYPVKELNDSGLVPDQLDDKSVAAFLHETHLNDITDQDDAQFLADSLVTWAFGEEFLEKHPRVKGWNK